MNQIRLLSEVFERSVISVHSGPMDKGTLIATAESAINQAMNFL